MTPNDQREQRRYELAKAAMEGILSSDPFNPTEIWDCSAFAVFLARDSVKCADALLAELDKAGKPEQQTPAPAQPTVSGHSGDCTIYSSLVNSNPECGICTCGYGWSLVRKGDRSQMYSAERKTPQPSPATGEGMSDEEILNKIHGHIDPNFTLGSLNFIRSLLAPVATRPMPSADKMEGAIKRTIDAMYWLMNLSNPTQAHIKTWVEEGMPILKASLLDDPNANTAAPKPILITKDQIEKWCREVPPHTKRKEAMAFAILNLKNLGLPVDLLMSISEAGLAHHKDCTQGVSSDICNCNQLEDAELANTTAPQAKRMTVPELAKLLKDVDTPGRAYLTMAQVAIDAIDALDAIAPGCRELTEEQELELANKCFLVERNEPITNFNEACIKRWIKIVRIARANPVEGK